MKRRPRILKSKQKKTNKNWNGIVLSFSKQNWNGREEKKISTNIINNSNMQHLDAYDKCNNTAY